MKGTATGRWLRPRAAIAAAALLAVLTGCAPAARGPVLSDTPAGQLERTAEIIYHRMAIGYLESGAYTTNVLVDVQLPPGAKWTVLAYARDGSSYRLRISSSQLPGIAWDVSPAGVQRVVAP